MRVYSSISSTHRPTQTCGIWRENGEGGQATIRSLSYIVMFTYAVKTMQELRETVTQQQIHIDQLEN